MNLSPKLKLAVEDRIAYLKGVKQAQRRISDLQQAVCLPECHLPGSQTSMAGVARFAFDSEDGTDIVLQVLPPGPWRLDKACIFRDFICEHLGLPEGAEWKEKP